MAAFVLFYFTAEIKQNITKNVSCVFSAIINIREPKLLQPITSHQLSA